LAGVASAAQLPAATSTAQGAIALGKDLGGTALLPQVTGLRGNPVQAGTPATNQILTWNGSAWTALNAPPSGAQIAQGHGEASVVGAARRSIQDGDGDAAVGARRPRLPGRRGVYLAGAGRPCASLR